MPNIKLTDYECRKNLLPKVCMFCGQPAVTRKQRNFAWHPPWVWILVLVGILVAAIVAIVLTKRMTVRVPVCEQHEGFWRRRGMTIGFSFLGIVLVEIAAAIGAANLPQGQDNLGGFVCAGGVFLLLGWLVLVAIYSTRSIRPTEITDRFIRLTGVHPEFIAALEDDRERDRDEEEEYRRQRRARRLAEEREQPRAAKRKDYDDDLERRANG
jgi:hypothetical protein